MLEWRDTCMHDVVYGRVHSSFMGGDRGGGCLLRRSVKLKHHPVSVQYCLHMRHVDQTSRRMIVGFVCAAVKLGSLLSCLHSSIKQPHWDVAHHGCGRGVLMNEMVGINTTLSLLHNSALVESDVHVHGMLRKHAVVSGIAEEAREEEVWHLGKAKVTQLDKALQVYEDILRLEVAVHNVVVVQVLKGQHYAANVELGQGLIHALQHLHLHPTCEAVM